MGSSYQRVCEVRTSSSYPSAKQFRDPCTNVVTFYKVNVAAIWEVPTKEFVKCGVSSVEEIKLKLRVFKPGEFW
jgi:hypothetical protein